MSATSDGVGRTGDHLAVLTGEVLKIAQLSPKDGELARIHVRLKELASDHNEMKMAHAITVERQDQLREKMAFLMRYFLTLWMAVCSLTTTGVKLDVVQRIFTYFS